MTGAILAAGGLLFAWFSIDQYDLGTLRRMGPGMFPLALGLVLAGLGVAIAAVAPDREMRRPEFRPRVAAMVVASVAAFGLLVGFLGLFPAIFATVMIASLADRPFRLVAAAILAAALCALSWLIFKAGLGLPLPVLRWPL